MLKGVGQTMKAIGRKMDQIQVNHLIRKKIRTTAHMEKELGRIKKINWKIYRIYD